LAVAISAADGLNETDSGPAPVINGEPGAGVRAPSGPTENVDTLLAFVLAVARSPPEGLNATDSGFEPVRNGEPGTCLRIPSALTANTETALAT
jgi:hypothetical protein